MHDNLNIYVEDEYGMKESKYEDFLKDLLNSFVNIENEYVNSLKNKKEIKEKDIEDFESILEYLNTKNEYIRVIKENNLHKFYED